MKHLPLIILSLLLLNSSLLSGQISILPKYSRGFLMTPYDRVKHLSAYTNSYELNVFKQTNGYKQWQRYYNYPSIGGRVQFLDLGTDVMGKVIGASADVRFHPIEKKRFGLDIQNSWGIGYFNKTYQDKTNFKNKAIGSPLNICFGLSIEAMLKLSDKVSLATGLQFTHYSSASYKIPNNGVNIPSFLLSVMYQTAPKIKNIEPIEVDSNEVAIKTFRLNLVYGNKVEGKFGERRFSILGFSPIFAKKVSKISYLGGGLDFYFDPSLQYETFKPYPKKDGIENLLQLGVKIHHTLQMGKLGFVSDAGVYLLNPNMSITGRYYQKIGLLYAINNNLNIQWLLKTHFGSADYFEFQVGYAL